MTKIFISLSVLFTILSKHPIHVALTDLVYNEQSKSMQITHKIFIDDLESDIQISYKKRGIELSLNLNTNKENPKSSEYIKEYIEQKLSLKINGKKCQTQFVGKEYETDAVWIYLEVLKLKAPKVIEIENAILMDLHEDQDNLLHYKSGEIKKSLRFTQKEQKGLLKL